MATSRTLPAARSPRPNVLIVDDDADIRDLLKAILENDYLVTEADSAAALRKAMDQKPPDVVLLDMKLPDAGGLGLLPAIKQRWPTTQVIVLTGEPADSGPGSWVAEATHAGAFGILCKSADFSIPKVLGCVSSALKRRGLALGQEPAPPHTRPEP